MRSERRIQLEDLGINGRSEWESKDWICPASDVDKLYGYVKAVITFVYRKMR